MTINSVDDIDKDVVVICGKCTHEMVVDTNDTRLPRAFDCLHCSYKTRVWLRYK